MNSEITISRQLVSGAIVAAAVIAANLLAAEPGDVEALDSTNTDRAVPEAPAPIVGIAAPDLRVSHARDDEIVVPALHRVEAGMPQRPTIEVEAVRQSAASWLGDGPMEAPDRAVEVRAPTVDTLAPGVATIDVPAFERPALPELPPVR